MKTAMQELIFQLAYKERRKYQDEQEKIIGGMNDCIMYDAIVIQNRVIDELTKEYAEYLEKEKEQIIEAHWAGWGHAYDYYVTEAESYDSQAVQAEDYYNETYNQNK